MNTTTSQLIVARAYIAEMSRLVCETPEQEKERVDFFGADCDKVAVIAGLAAKLAEILDPAK